MTFLNILSLFIKEDLKQASFALSMTLLLSVVGTFLGFIIGLLLLLARDLKINKTDPIYIKIAKYIGIYFARIYITLFRGTPMIVQSIIIYFGLKPYLQWNVITAALFIVSINTAAYIAEIVRSGVNAIDPGQMEAARSLGFSKTRANFLVIYPQAVKNSLPAIGNEFIVNLKDTAVLSVIGIFDLFNFGKAVYTRTYNINAYLAVAGIYLILTFLTSLLIKYLEKRREKGGLKSNA